MHAVVVEKDTPFEFSKKGTFQVWVRMDKMSKNVPVIDFPPHCRRGYPSVVIHCLHFFSFCHKLILHACARTVKPHNIGTLMSLTDFLLSLSEHLYHFLL